MIPLSRLRAAACVLGGGALLLTFTPDGGAATEAWRARVAPALQSLHDAPRSLAPPGTRLDTQGRVEADVHHACGSAAPLAALAAAGFTVKGGVEQPPLCAVEGWVSPASLPEVAALAGVTQVRLPSYAHRAPRPVAREGVSLAAGTLIDGNALTILHADQFVQQAGGGGGGVLVGIQSSGIASLSLIQNRGELPTGITDYTAKAGSQSSPYMDEGTALLEEVHAVAPDARLAFCDPQTFVEYTACLQQFAQAGATVVADDMLFMEQDPMSSSGTDTAAVEQFLAAHPNVAMFTSAGNDYGSYWEGYYNPVAAADAGRDPLPSCSATGQTNPYLMRWTNGGEPQILDVLQGTGGTVPATFAWADPPGTNHSSFDLYVTRVDSTGVPLAGATPTCLLSTASSTSPVANPPFSYVQGYYRIDIATADDSLRGKFLKLWVGGDGLTTLSVATGGSVVSPQSFAAGVVGIGAVDASDGIGNQLEYFSSQGPIHVIYPQERYIVQPLLSAPDSIVVDASGTYFAAYLFPDGTFKGTSAAVPNAAAVAALLRGAFPSLTVPQVVKALEDGAVQLSGAVPDGGFGYGRVDAIGARGTFPAPTLTALTDVSIDASASTTSSSQTFQITGTSTLHFTVKSSNPTLVPEHVGPGAGVTVSPADCGGTTLTCTLTVTAASYQGGEAALTFNAVDGAGRAAPATLHVTVTNPQTAPVQTQPVEDGSAGGGGGGGGALQLWELLALGGLVLRRVRRIRLPSAG